MKDKNEEVKLFMEKISRKKKAEIVIVGRNKQQKGVQEQSVKVNAMITKFHLKYKNVVMVIRRRNIKKRWQLPVLNTSKIQYK